MPYSITTLVTVLFLAVNFLCTIIQADFKNNDHTPPTNRHILSGGHQRQTFFKNRFNKPESYKLTYFNIRGRAEPIRLLFVDNDIKFENNQVAWKDWPALKPSMPFGQLPVLYRNGEPLAQTGAILRHLARRYGLYGSTPEHKAFIDMIYEAVVDAKANYNNYIWSKMPKSSFIKPAKEEVSKILKVGFKHPTYPNLKNTSFVAGEKISYADYAFFDFLDVLLAMDGNILNEPRFQLVKKYYESMAKRPKLAAYFIQRKNTPINLNGKQ